MHVRKYKTDKEALISEGKKIVAESADAKFVHRVSMVNLLLAGLSPSLLSEYCGDSKRTLMSWVQKVDTYGWESLATKKQEGRPRKLDSKQENEIREALNNDPTQYGYNVWDGPSLSDYISKTYQISLSVRSCQYLMHRLGFNLIRPQTYPSLENPQEEIREEFKKKSEGSNK